MARAYVLINTEIGAEEEVKEQLLGMDAVTSVDIVYGVYDCIATLERDSMNELKEAVTQNLRALEKVRSTMTMICVEK